MPAEDGESASANVDDDASLSATRKQVEFYFADSNLPYDKFMWSLHTANDDHWVPIKTISSFKRMRQHAERGHDFVLRALATSTELEVDEKGENVRRTTELRKPKDQFERSIYVKGFGEERDGLQRDLEAFFEKYGRVNAVRMRRVDGKKEFKGSVFVEYADMAGVESFLNAEPKPTWNDQELLIMSKEAYCDMKIKEKGLKGKAADLRKDTIASKRGFNAFREMENPSRSKSKSNGSKSKQKPEVLLEFMGKKIRVYDDGGGDGDDQEEEGVGYVKTEDVPFVRGATLKFTGCGGDASFTEIKAPLRERFARVPYIQFTKGDDWGLVGFDKALKEEEIEYVKEHLGTVNEREVVWTVPDEEEEKQFQIDRANFAAKSALSRSQIRKGGSGSRGGSRGGGRGGRGSGRGGRQGGGDRETRKKDKDKDKDKDGGAMGPVQIAQSESQTGEKRKRAVEPDGGPDEGVRGTGVPTIAASAAAGTSAGGAAAVEESASKKIKADES